MIHYLIAGCDHNTEIQLFIGSLIGESQKGGKMKALVLGGAGAVCSETTRDLAKTSDYEEIIVADYNLLSG